MYRCITEISFQQLTQVEGKPKRDLSLFFDFVNEFEATDIWTDLTNTCKIKFPKNIYFKDAKTGALTPLGGTTTSKQINELFLRGDKVSVSYGYYLEDGRRTADSVNKVFEGYISAVHSKKPIELDCEDNMWLLKQISVKRQTISKTKSIQTFLTEVLTGTGLTVNTSTNITIGEFIVQNETVAQFLARLRKEFHLESYFYGSELRVGLSPYSLVNATLRTFIFQQNIISDELEWRRKDDVKLSAVCQSINTVVQSSTNKKGEAKTKKEQLSVLVYNDNGTFKYIKKEKGVDFPANEEGERRTLFFPNVLEASKLFELGVAELKKYYYEGFAGNFTTFGYPKVKMGDNVKIIDKLMPDRDGTYLVRGVEFSGGTNGHRQKITLDYKLF